LFPADICVNPFFNGQAIGGLIVACANFITSFLNGSANFLMQYCSNQYSFETSANIATAPSDDDSLETNGETICIPYGEVSFATAGYFSMGGFILAVCMIGYNYVDRYKRLVRKNSFGVKDKTTAPDSDKVDLDVSDYDDNERWNSNEQSQLLIEGRIHQTRKSYVQKITTQISNSYQHNGTGVNQVRRQNSADTDASESTQSVTFFFGGPISSAFATVTITNTTNSQCRIGISSLYHEG